MDASIRDGLWAAVPAAALSGLPSTAYALVRGRDVLEAAVAAGALVAPSEQRRPRLVVYAMPVHAAISVFWSVLLARALPRRCTVLLAVAGGGAIAAIDLGMIGRRLPALRSLDQRAQIVDHLAFGGVVGAVVRLRRTRRLAGEGKPLRTVTAERILDAAPGTVFDFLSVLDNHWLLTGHFADVVETPRQGASGAAGKVRVKGWFGVGRTVHTRLTAVSPPSRLSGEAFIGRQTRATLTWDLLQAGDGTKVMLRAEVRQAGWLDHLLVDCAGWWLERNFDRVLAELERAVSPR